MNFILSRHKIKLYAVAILLCFPMATCTPSGPEPIRSLHGQTMGTTYHIQVAGKAGLLSEQKLKELKQGIQEILNNVDKAMSTWRADSEISRFNRLPAGKFMHFSDDVMAVLQLAETISIETHGAFDISVGALVNLWGFGSASDGKVVSVPGEQTIQAKMAGYQAIHLDPGKAGASKQKALEIDLSAIAKGYAVDKLAAYLDLSGIPHYLAEIGGEIRARGGKPDGSPWRVAIEAPVVGERKAQRVLLLTSGAMATSGDYRNFFEKDGKRYPHTIDPVSGKPVTHALASVTVIGVSVARADALATALMVMGPDKGKQFALSHALPVYFIVRKKDGFGEYHTPLFESYLAVKSLK